VTAARIADPNSTTGPHIDRWVTECANYLINDAVSEFAVQMPNASDLATQWITSDLEFTAATGWNVIAHLAIAKTLDPGHAGPLIEEIQGQIHAAPNRTRHSMNGALVAIGGTIPELTTPALAAAKSIGKVTVDHGKTGCKTHNIATASPS
jgi:3-methyladenine DNA glycosylase AlkD